MFRKVPALIFFFLLALAVAGCTSSSRLFGPAPLSAPSLQFRSAAQRTATLEALRTAWEARPQEYSAANERAERMFLNRMIVFLYHIRGREVKVAACNLWNHCYHDHATRYGDFIAVDSKSPALRPNLGFGAPRAALR